MAQPQPSGTAELSAWHQRFPQYEYRPQDDCVALKLSLHQPSENAVEVPDPIARMTHHDEPMVFLSASECAHYCDEGEVPIPLAVGLQAEDYAAARVRAALAQQAKTGNPVLPENQEVAQQASGQDQEDPLQPAANWLVNAANLTATQVAGNLCIGINRAQRLYDVARAAAKAQPGPP